RQHRHVDAACGTGLGGPDRPDQQLRCRRRHRHRPAVHPHIFLSAWAGLLADRVDRRKLLMITQGGMGVLGLGLGALVLSGAAELWHVYVFAALLGVVSAV